MKGPYKISVRHGEKTVSMEYFGDPFQAEERYRVLCGQRIDGPGAVILLNNNIVRKVCRIDADWPGDRITQDEPLLGGTP